jgi:hypothetical protein
MLFGRTNAYKRNDLETKTKMLMNHALRYAADGFAVFPCRLNGKEPLGSLVPNGCLDATTDTETIKGWWAKCPNANIGLATGMKNGLAVVDLDGMEGINSGKSMGLMSSVVALTGNGRQLFYADPEAKLKNSVKKLAAGVDTRGSGGYVIVPPSLHPNGKRYSWLGQPLSRKALPPLPSMFAAGNASDTATFSTVRKANPPNWMDEAIAKLRDGHVHNNLISVLGKFRTANFSEEATYSLLKPHALENGQPFEGLRDKIAEIWKRYSVATTMSGSTEDIDQFLDQITEVDWICKPFFAKKSIGFVVGLPETLKTWLLIDLAIECARDSGLWLGKFPISPSRVLFIDQERFKGETQRRFNAMIAAKGLTRTELKGKLSIKCGTTIRLDLEESFQAFKRELLATRPEVVIVDSFATFHNSPENDRMAIQQVLNKIKGLRDEIGCSFVFINHENKSAYPNGEPAGEPHMGTMAGSVGVGAAAEFCLTVRKVEQGTSIVWHTKSTLATASKSFYATVKDVENGIEVRALED